MIDPPNRELAVFSAARKLPVSERAAYLAEACAGDAALRQRVEELLQAGDEAGAFLDRPAPGAQRDGQAAGASDPSQTIRINPAPAEKTGDRIGRYKLLQQIGEGGCGVVYMAEQEEPVRRQVALKVIKLGMDTKSVIARFEAERQALALMDHPNIAKVLDAGATESGRPYFVMELVRGIKITDYSDKANLSTRERLNIFVQVCQAIQHAHQKGIIHRDIKPSNILVALRDGVPVPKVIDFGIAKATTDQRLTDKTLFTAFEQFMGTPAYMSPEQAEMSELGIDTRSDIYSLGVLLYELLTGQTPFDAKELLQSGLDAMRRMIREKEPARPSTCLTTMTVADLTEVAKHRQVEPAKLKSVISGDLDWIVMKSLEKDRARRYETAGGFAADVQRHLGNEPVEARPPSSAYRLQKAVRRNKAAFAAGTAILVVLLIGVIASATEAIRAKRAEREQTRLRTDAEKSRVSETKERNSAEERLYDSLLAQARAIRHSQRVGYRDTVFALLGQARSLNVPQRDLAELRREAMECTGDFVGLTPTTFADYPTGAWNTRMQLSPNDQMAAFALTDQTNETILLRQLPSGVDVAHLPVDVAHLTNEANTTSFCFNANGDQLIALHTPRDGGGPMDEKTQLFAWAAGADGQWRQTEKASLPGAARCFSSTKGLFVAACDPALPMGYVWRLIDLKTRETIQTFECRFIDQGRSFPFLAMSPDGKFLAVSKLEGDKVGVIDLWDLNAHQRVETFRPDVDWIASLDFSPDGKYLACLGRGGCAIYAMNDFHRANTFKEQFAWPANPNYFPKQVSFAPGDTVVALPTLQQNRLRLWDFDRNRDMAILEEEEASKETAFAANSSFILTSSSRHTRLYHLHQTPEEMRLPVHDALETAFSPDGARIALTGGNLSSGTVAALRVCDVMTGRILWESAVAGDAPGPGVAYSPDGRTIATAGLGIQFWDADTGKLLLETATNQTQHSTGMLHFTSDGHQLLAGAELDKAGCNIDVWAVERRGSENSGGGLEAKLLNSYDAKLEAGDALPAFALAPDDRHVACGCFRNFSFKGKIYICELDGPAPPRLLETNINVIGLQNWTQTSDRRQLLAVDAEREVVTLDVATGEKVSSFPIGPRPAEETEWIGALALSPDGTKLAVDEDTSRNVDIYDPKTGRLLYSLPDQNGMATWLTWSPDSQRLAVSRSNGEVAIWNVFEVERTLAKLKLSP